MNIENIPVRKMDILKEMELYSNKLRESAAEKLSDNELKAYDVGVKHAMNILEMLVCAKDEKGVGSLIYQKHGEETHEVEEYVRLSEVLVEVYHD